MACATIGYLRDAWAQYWREHVLGGEFIRSEWKSFTSHSILSTPSLGIALPLLLESMYPHHTRSRSTVAWTGASQGSLTHALLPSGASSSLSSSLDVNKCGPALPVLIAFCLCSPGLGACGLQGLLGCQPTAWAIFMHTHDNSILHSSMTPHHSKSLSPPSLSLIICTRMISSTAICSLKFSSQSKWQHPTASVAKKHVSTFTYWTTNVPYPNSSWGIVFHRMPYWVGRTFTMPCTAQYCTQRQAYAITTL